MQTHMAVSAGENKVVRAVLVGDIRILDMAEVNKILPALPVLEFCYGDSCHRVVEYSGCT